MNLNLLSSQRSGGRTVTWSLLRYLSTTPKTSEDEAALKSKLLRDEATLYVHWPYCQKRCHYCNFNKYIRSNVDHERMKDCLVQETRSLLALSGVKSIRSIFFGGGTPSLAKPSTITAIVESVRSTVSMRDDAEITMEANPTSAEASILAEFKTAGINRLSLGLQSFRDSVLKLLGRNHSSLDSIKALEGAKYLFPGSVSIDLIFGIPGQTLREWIHELEKALQVCDDHISLYQLTLERGTNLFKRNNSGEISLPDTDIMADMYQTAVRTMSKAGFSRYEVSNFARGNSGSIHNQSYWTGGQYIGVGPGAHGRFTPSEEVGRESLNISREARVQTLEPDAWMCEVEKYGQGTCKIIKLSKLDVLRELIMTGLRTSKGIQDSTWAQLSGNVSLQEVFGSSESLRSFCQQGFVEISSDRMRVTDDGLIVLDSLIPDILNVLTEYFAP